jgi:hypothetical protein
MLLTVKKQIEETVEFKSPAYYKDTIGNLHYINEAGQLTTVRRKMINMWEPEDGKIYNEAVEELWTWGTPCTKEEFDEAYTETLEKMNEAVGLVEVNS